MLYPSRKRIGNAWSSTLLAQGSQTITDPASRWLGHDWPCTLQKWLNWQSEFRQNQSLALHASGHFGSATEILKADLLHCQTSHVCLAGLVLQLRLTYTRLLERKRKERWFLKDNFFVFILSQLDKNLSSKCSVMFRGRSLSWPSDFGFGRVHRCAFIPPLFMDPAESPRHQPWPYQSRNALSRSLCIDW